jgi:hypothetical protein
MSHRQKSRLLPPLRKRLEFGQHVADLRPIAGSEFEAPRRRSDQAAQHLFRPLSRALVLVLLQRGEEF